MSFPIYPSHKDSSVEWLGAIPTSWDVQPVYAFSTCNDEVLEENTPSDFPINYVEISDVDPIAGVGPGTELLFAAAPSRARRRVRPGDVLISTVRTYLRAIAPVRSPLPSTIASTGFAVMRPRKIDPGYLGYLFQSEYMVSEIIARSVGVSYPAINAHEITRLKAPVPPPHEQILISDFLDRETAKIDALVAEQERLMALLKEKRQALISQAVTKGLDPDAPMKPSGVEWLGDVPAHWEIVPLKSLTQEDRPIMYGIVLPGPDVGTGVPILKGGNVKPSRMNLDSMARTTPEIELPFARARLREGDLVYSIRGSIGDCEPVPVELEGSNITQDVARIAPRTDIDAQWLRYALLSAPVSESLASGSLGAAVRGVNIFDLKRARIPTPPAQERNRIAAYVGEQLFGLGQLAEKAGLAIALLKERRAALISAAVTGKIDVRCLDAQAQEAA